jgi:uncharacterized protein (DUF736 family)
MDKQDRLGALWIKTSKNGIKFLSGKVGDVQVVVFKNGYNKEDKHPDFIVYKSTPKPQGQNPDNFEDDIPFA